MKTKKFEKDEQIIIDFFESYNDKQKNKNKYCKEYGYDFVLLKSLIEANSLHGEIENFDDVLKEKFSGDYISTCYDIICHYFEDGITRDNLIYYCYDKFVNTKYENLKDVVKNLKYFGFVVDYDKMYEIVSKNVGNAFATWQEMVDEFVKDKSVAFYIRNPLEYAMRKFQTKQKSEDFFNWALEWREESKSNKGILISEKALLSYTKFFMFRASDEEFKVFPKLVEHADSIGNMPHETKFTLKFLRTMYSYSADEQDKFFKERYPYLLKLGFNINAFDINNFGSVKTIFKYISGQINWKGGIDISIKPKEKIREMNSLLHAAIKRLPSSKEILDILLKCEDLDINLRNPDFFHLVGIIPENKTSGNTPVHQLVRIAGYYNDKLIDQYFDKFVQKGAKIDAYNNRGESVIASAIHHGYVHGVDVCKKLIYPEILHDIAKLDGVSQWISIKPEIRDILFDAFPDMTDDNDMTYLDFLNYLKKGNFSSEIRGLLLNFPEELKRNLDCDYIKDFVGEGVNNEFWPNSWEKEERDDLLYDLILRNPWVLSYETTISVPMSDYLKEKRPYWHKDKDDEFISILEPTEAREWFYFGRIPEIINKFVEEYELKNPIKGLCHKSFENYKKNHRTEERINKEKIEIEEKRRQEEERYKEYDEKALFKKRAKLIIRRNDVKVKAENNNQDVEKVLAEYDRENRDLISKLYENVEEYWKDCENWFNYELEMMW